MTYHPRSNKIPLRVEKDVPKPVATRDREGSAAAFYRQQLRRLGPGKSMFLHHKDADQVEYIRRIAQQIGVPITTRKLARDIKHEVAGIRIYWNGEVDL